MSEDDEFEERLIMTLSPDELKTIEEAFAILDVMVNLDKSIFEKAVYILMAHDNLDSNHSKKEFLKKMRILRLKIQIAI